jgi:phenazine biosynthesis protein phzE
VETSQLAPLVALLDHAPAFALLRRQGEPHLDLLVGDPVVVKTLADIPLPAGRPAGGAPCHDVLAAVPYAQVWERGYDRHDDGTPLTCLLVREARRLPLPEALAALPAGEVTLTGEGR